MLRFGQSLLLLVYAFVELSKGETKLNLFKKVATINCPYPRNWKPTPTQIDCAGICVARRSCTAFIYNRAVSGCLIAYFNPLTSGMINETASCDLYFYGSCVSSTCNVTANTCLPDEPARRFYLITERITEGNALHHCAAIGGRIMEFPTLMVATIQRLITFLRLAFKNRRIKHTSCHWRSDDYRNFSNCEFFLGATRNGSTYVWHHSGVPVPSSWSGEPKNNIGNTKARLVLNMKMNGTEYLESSIEDVEYAWQGFTLCDC